MSSSPPSSSLPSSSSTGSGSSNPSNSPQVLTRSAIPSLTKGLDASDALEVYALYRQAPLHGLANSTLTVGKMAIGIRYRNPSILQQLEMQAEPKKLSLTLEYGPPRMGLRMDQEGIPIVHNNEEETFMTWDNQGRIYITTDPIVDRAAEFSSAYYLASMTGAVLSTLLEKALEYQKRYQPFAVYLRSEDNDRDRLLLRSSNSFDFGHYIFEQLALLGVVLEPILPPPRYEFRLYVSSYVQKLSAHSADETTGELAAHAAAVFYQRLYDCVEAIATGDYRLYTSAPTSAPSAAPSALPHTGTEKERTAHNHTTSNSTPSVLPDGPTNSTAPNPENTTSTKEPKNDDGGTAEADSSSVSPNATDANARNGQDPDVDSNSTTFNSTDTGENRTRKLRRLEDASTTQEDLLADDSSGTLYPTSEVPDDVDPGVKEEEEEDPTETAKQAAEAAQEAADQAKNAAITQDDSIAANAAQAAADAAQKAAVATTNAAQKAAMENLLNGDGNTKALTAASCFQELQYNIYDPSGPNSTTYAYVYLDGISYYRLNLTKPYLEIRALRNRPLPQPPEFGGLTSGGDLVDWSLALSLIGLVFFGILVIYQKIQGYALLRPLYKCQLWFFEPRHYNREELLEDENFTGHNQRGRGQAFNFGEDVIPLSMGGRRRPSYEKLKGENMYEDYHDESLTERQSLVLGDVEMTTRNSSTRRRSTVTKDNGNHESAPSPTVSNTRTDSNTRPKPRDSMQGQGKRSSPSSLALQKRSPRRTLSGDSSPNHTDMAVDTSSAFTKKRSSSNPDFLDLHEDPDMILGNRVPERFMRHPDLVDLPSLKSKSKVAVPVSLNSSTASLSSIQQEGEDSKTDAGIV